jgi:hypothetical protein
MFLKLPLREKSSIWFERVKSPRSGRADILLFTKKVLCLELRGLLKGAGGWDFTNPLILVWFCPDSTRKEVNVVVTPA